MRVVPIKLVCGLVGLLLSASGCELVPLATLWQDFNRQPRDQSAHFECGSLGSLHKRHKRKFDLILRSDNGDPDLPKYWRQWWYSQLDLPKGTSTLTLKGRGHWNYYLPVFSLDQKNWRQFRPEQVSQPKRHQLQIKARFPGGKVWLARYVPYSYSRQMRLLDELPKPIEVKVEALGHSPKGRLVPLLTSRPQKGQCQKGHVVIHARTHPGEVGASFLLEGLLRELTATHRAARRVRQELCFTIVPMVNVDGVIAGNNRTNLASINLEGKWFMAPGDPDDLLGQTPQEVRLLHKAFLQAQEQGNVTVALNLHASNGRPQDQVFFFPHFGPARKGYSRREVKLYSNQRRLIRHYASLLGADGYTKTVVDGGRDFIEKDMPESYWWKKAGPKVNALSMEATYGLVPGGRQEWKTPADIKFEGQALFYSLARYHRVLSYPQAKSFLATTLQKTQWPYQLPTGLFSRSGADNPFLLQLQR
mgnify:CR=1 FL=1